MLNKVSSLSRIEMFVIFVMSLVFNLVGQFFYLQSEAKSPFGHIYYTAGTISLISIVLLNIVIAIKAFQLSVVISCLFTVCSVFGWFSKQESTQFVLLLEAYLGFVGLAIFFNAKSIVPYSRIWKLATLCAGIFLLIIGSAIVVAFNLVPDWDIGISLAMGVVSYASAPVVYKKIVKIQEIWMNRNQFAGKIRFTRLVRLIMLISSILFLVWFSVDGSYLVYWTLKDPSVLYMRAYQWPLSLALYATCLLMWGPDLSFRQMVAHYKNKLISFHNWCNKDGSQV